MAVGGALRLGFLVKKSVQARCASLGLLPEVAAPGRERTLLALGFLRGADIAAMEQQPVVGPRQVGGGDMSQQCLFHLEGRIGCGGHETQTVGDAVDVGVDSDGGLVEGHG